MASLNFGTLLEATETKNWKKNKEKVKLKFRKDLSIFGIEIHRTKITFRNLAKWWKMGSEFEYISSTKAVVLRSNNLNFCSFYFPL